MARLNQLSAVLTVALLILVAGGGWEGIQVYRAVCHNQVLANIANLQPTANTKPDLLAAKANWYVQTGQTESALRLYTQALSQAEGELKQKLNYNLGTLYLEQAADLWNRQGVWAYSRVITLLSLARDYLREAVRLDPEDLNARYNLEYALRITPPPREREPAKWQGTKASIFAILPALPQGGP